MSYFLKKAPLLCETIHLGAQQFNSTDPRLEPMFLSV